MTEKTLKHNSVYCYNCAFSLS